jgi:hypothetical protein
MLSVGTRTLASFWIPSENLQLTVYSRILSEPFLQFQMAKKIRCGLESRADSIRCRELDFGKMLRAAVRTVRTIQHNNLLFYLLFIILYNTLYNTYNLLFITLAVITHNPIAIIFIFTIALP